MIKKVAMLKPNSRMYQFSEKLLISFLTRLGRALRGKKIDDNHCRIIASYIFSALEVALIRLTLKSKDTASPLLIF